MPRQKKEVVSKKKVVKKGTRAKKDPNAPKRAKSAWIYYTVEQRPEFKKKYPELKMTDITKKMGKKWRKMDDDDKAEYVEMAAEDKLRWEKEKAAYEKSSKNKSESTEESESTESS